VIGQVMPTNPAAAVRGPKHVVKTGKTPVLEGAEWRKLLKSIPDTTLRDLRDRALIATLTYSFARINAALKMKVEDLRPRGAGWTVRLHEKGGALPSCGGLRHGRDRDDAFPSGPIVDGAFTSSAETDAPPGPGQR
jgi:integrase